MKSRAGIVVGAAIAALAAFAMSSPAVAAPSPGPSAGPSGSASAGAVPGSKTFTIGYLGDMDSANPYAGQLSLSYEVYGDVYDVLEGWSRKDYSPVPGLASSWTHSDDGLTWTFTIRSGVKWSDGVPLTASDVAYSFNRAVKDPNGTYSNYVKSIKSVDATNPTTAVFHLSAPDSIMTQLWVPVLPEHIWSKVTDANETTFTNTAMVGSGAFTLDRWVKKQYIRLKANKSYWGGTPKIDYLVYRVYNDDDAMIQALRKGDIDAVVDLGANDYKALDGAPGITRLTADGTSFQYLAFNMGGSTVDGKPVGDGDPSGKDPKFREAVADAMNLPLLKTKVLQGLGQVGQSVVPPSYSEWAWNPGTAAHAYDPDHAKQLLDAAGYTAGKDGFRISPVTHKEMNLRLLAPNDSPDYKASVAYIVAWLKDVGIKVTPKLVSYDEVINEAGNAEYDLTYGDWGVEPDPSFQLSTMTCGQRDTGTSKSPVGGWSDSFYCDPAYDKLYDQQAAALDPAQRADTVRQMQQKLYTDNPYIVLYYPDELQAYNSAKWTGVELQGGSAFMQDGLYTYLNLDVKADAPKAKGASTGLIIGVVAIVVVIVLAGGFVLLRRRATADERE